MKCARQSRYWRTYRDSKTFTLTIYIYEAHLGFANGSGGSLGSGFHSSSFHGSSFSNLNLHGNSVDTSLSGSSSGSGHGPWDTKIVVSLPKDPMGERHETSRAGKTPNPVWDQAVVFRDIDYSELVRVEMRGIRKLGDNPALASVEFEVHDVMGLSLRDVPSVFQLECDRSRARYGVILLAFRFDPPVAADVLGEFDGIGSAMVPRGLSAAPDQGKEEDPITPAWGRRELSQPPEVEPVYINVDGHFACLLLDDDTSAYPCKPHSARPSTSSSSSVSFGLTPGSFAAAARDKDASPGRSRASIPGGLHHAHAHPHLHHPRLSVGSNNSAKSENSIFDPESLIHGRGSAVRMAALAEALSARDGGGGKRRSPVGKDSRTTRPKSLGSSLAHQLSALGLGVGGGAGGGSGGGGGGGVPKAASSGSAGIVNSKRGKPASVDLRRGSSSDDAARIETPQHRWSLARRRLKHHEHHAAPAAGGGIASNAAAAGADCRGGGKRVRSRGGFSRGAGFPILGSLRARAAGGAARVRSKSTSAATPYAVDSVDSSCASTVRAGEEALVYEPAPLAEPSGGAARPYPPLLASAVCDVPVSLELSPTGFKAPPLLNRSLSEELTGSAKE